MIRFVFNPKRLFGVISKKSKPEDIQFSFNIPKKHTVQQKQSKDQVHWFRAKRPNVSQILNKKRLSDIQKQQVQKDYQNQILNKVQGNVKTQNYHMDQYFKGQHLIDNIPLDPYYQYRLEDFKRKYKQKQEELKSFVEPFIDLQKRATIKEQMAHAYHQKQNKYETQQFVKYLDNYPGSPKGPKPQDDMDYFIQYAKKKIPEILLNELKLEQSADSLKIKAKSDNLNFQTLNFNSSKSITDIFSVKRDFDQESLSKMKWNQVFSSTENVPIFTPYSQVPQFPQTQFRNYHQHIGELTNWNNFRNNFKQKHGFNKFQEQMAIINQIYEDNDQDPENKYFSLKPSIPSLYRYYKSLPKQVQDHPGLKDIYLGLQYKSPDWTYQQKEDALNYAATLIQPLDKLSQKAIEDFANNGKYRITPFMVQKVYTINPQFTWDIKQFLNEIKQEQLRGQSMVKQAEQKYPEPPPKHLDWEEGTANLPVDFYDNDDGFWDSIISEKLKRYDQAKPMLKVRKHFQH